MKSWKILSLVILLLLMHIEARYTWNGKEWIWNEDLSLEVNEDIQESSGDYQNDDEDIEGSGSSFEQEVIASTTPLPNLATSTIANLIHVANKDSEESSDVYLENNTNPVLEESIVARNNGTFFENEIERSIGNVEDICECEKIEKENEKLKMILKTVLSKLKDVDLFIDQFGSTLAIN